MRVCVKRLNNWPWIRRY